jgi:hypothetical protein
VQYCTVLPSFKDHPFFAPAYLFINLRKIKSSLRTLEENKGVKMSLWKTWTEKLNSFFNKEAVPSYAEILRNRWDSMNMAYGRKLSLDEFVDIVMSSEERAAKELHERLIRQPGTYSAANVFDIKGWREFAREGFKKELISLGVPTESEKVSTPKPIISINPPLD